MGAWFKYITKPVLERLINLSPASSASTYPIMSKPFPRADGAFIGKLAIFIRAAYGLKSAGADFRNHLRNCMAHLGYESCKADPDVWMWSATRTDDQYYYEYILMYVDDCLCISENPNPALLQVDKYFPIKPASLGPPKTYLGEQFQRYNFQMVSMLGHLVHHNMYMNQLKAWKNTLRR